MSLSIMAISCSKENLDEKTSEALLVNKDYIAFENVKNYESFLENGFDIQKNSLQQDFISFNDVSFKNFPKEEEKEINGFSEDHTLLKILNKRGAVKIGGWMCQLDFYTKKVYAVSMENYDRLSEKNLKKRQGLYVFDFDEEVTSYIEVADSEDVDLYEARNIINEGNNSLRGCSSVGNRKKEKEKCSDLQYTENNGQKFSAKVKLVFQKAGVYFSVKAKVKNYKIGVGCNLNKGDQFITFGNVHIKRKKGRFGCKTKKVGAEWSYVTVSEGGSSDKNNSQSILTHFLYEGSRGLRELDVTATLQWKAYSGSYATQHITFNIKK